jgi:GNAT superfamily N-acetyltransferase
VEVVPGDHPDVVALAHDLVLELAARYGDDDPTSIHRPHPGARWVLLLDDDGDAIGCGAIQPWSWSEPGGAAEIGEVKRVYVVPAHRGRGHAHAIMAALVDLAAAEGYRRLHLETGTAQPEAIALYTGLGWDRIPNYGQYAEDPRSVCFGRDLVLDARDRPPDAAHPEPVADPGHTSA